MRLNLHARIEIAIVGALLLGSCDQPDWKDRLDVADTNGRNAIYKVNELESRVEEIEVRLRM